MNKLFKAAVPLGMLVAGDASAETVQISRNGDRPAVAGAETNFTGRVTVTPLFGSNAYSNAGGGQVEFTPDARTAWHTHPAGQTLIVTSGRGWVQQEGGAKIEIKPGDVVSIPPAVKHWHGAADSSSMTHIAITPSVDGQNVNWLEPVTDEQYRQP
ncbi:MAG TPA: cupin domain-containing protein [Dongiaceae bacterium]